MSGDPTVVQLDVAFRNFLFMRGQAVKDTRDALTELITNAVDAYRRVPGYETMDKRIDVIFHRVPRPDARYDIYLEVIDGATGVVPERMRECFLSAGNKTASDTSRGFFSTGAKNITIFGDVHYTSVTGGVLSKVYLDDMSYGHIVTHGPIDPDDPARVPDVVGVEITQDQRDTLHIQGSGMNVVLVYTNQSELAKLESLDQIDHILESVGKIATLRDIFSNPTYHVYVDIRTTVPNTDILNVSGYTEPLIHTDPNLYDPSMSSDNYGGRYYRRITYMYPESSLFLDTTFTVPAYPHYQARFVINRAVTPIPQPVRENQMEFGFLIKDSLAVHEVNTLGENERYRWNPNINYLFGYVFCDGFNAELQRYDRDETKELIIDPNRVGGIDHTHPLYVSILSVCLPRLELAIRQVQSESTFKSINIDELDTIVNELEGLGVNIFDSSDITFNFTPETDGPLAISLKETENHIVKEISNETNLKLITSDSLALEELQKATTQLDTGAEYHVFYYDAQGDLQSIPTDGPAHQLSGDSLQSLIDSLDNMSVDRPFIYRMNAGDWSRVEIYQRGKINRLADQNDSLIKVAQKSLTIQFVNEIHRKEKYIIDDTSGLAIKINLHNEVVANKLSKTKIDNLENAGYAFKLSDEASYDALNFLETLMVSAFTDIIVNNDIQNRKLIIDDGSVTSAKRVVDYRTKIESDIDYKVQSLFANFLAKKKKYIYDNVRDSVTLAKMSIIEMFMNTSTTIDNIEQGADRLASAIETTIQTLIDR